MTSNLPYGIVYCTTNLVNGKKYIGKLTFGGKKKDYYLGSSPLLSKAIKKYGKDNFNRVSLQDCVSREDLIESEIYWINYFGAVRSNLFYNLQDGGDGGMSSFRKENFKAHPNSIKALLDNKIKKHSEVSKALMRTSHFGIKMPIKTREAINKARVKSVVKLNKNGEFLLRFDSIKEAALSLCTIKSVHGACTGITDVAKGNKKTCGGFKWMYLEDYNNLINGK